MVMKPPAPEPAFTPASAAPKIAQGWYQTDTHVVIDIFIKKANKQNVIVKFGDNSVEFTHRLSEDSETNFDFDPLFGQIVPDESSYEVLSTKIEVRLKKKVPGSKWTSLVADKNDDKVEVKDAAHKYPTSSKVQRNWDKIAKDTENDPELKPSGEQAMTQLFQQIYRDGDENTRRAMIKSYQESNGTALSTNWEEVKKNPVETKPPESMLAKKYEY
ncbi:Cochaperone protein [Spiromyces aspiralis]|uniref:Cochaperone protein n=1 Tax=Spiromyces aspiralis TaxID=68401 RepID=A0ACC1HU78_9FUNG|nr:Cochaperone protein [Spiromyces aspiralis]